MTPVIRRASVRDWQFEGGNDARRARFFRTGYIVGAAALAHENGASQDVAPSKRLGEVSLPIPAHRRPRKVSSAASRCSIRSGRRRRARPSAKRSTATRRARSPRGGSRRSSSATHFRSAQSPITPSVRNRRSIGAGRSARRANVSAIISRRLQRITIVSPNVPTARACGRLPTPSRLWPNASVTTTKRKSSALSISRRANR